MKKKNYWKKKNQSQVKLLLNNSKKKFISLGIKKIGGKNQNIFNEYQPPKKKIIKWTDEIIKCRYSHK